MTVRTWMIVFAGVVIGLNGTPARTFAQPASDRRQRFDAEPVWLFPNRDAPLGTRYHVFESAVVKQRASCLVWLPPEYSRATSKRFPVIYYLHGARGDQRTCTEKYLPRYIQALANGEAPAAIIVAVNGFHMSMYADSVDGRCPIESVIIKDLIPHIDREYRTLAARKGRMIEGSSMGGLGAARLGFKYPELFGAIVINCAGPLESDRGIPPVLSEVFGGNEKARTELPGALAERNADALRKDTIIRMVCGTEDNLLPVNRRLHEQLNQLDIGHRYIEVPGAGHGGEVLYQQLGARAYAVHLRAFGGLEAGSVRPPQK